MHYLSITFAIFLIPVLISTVSSQTQAILIPNAIQDKKPFTITCDPSKVGIPSQDSDIQHIYDLMVYMNTTVYPNYNLAQYHPTLDPNDMNYVNVPPGRSWTVSSSGGNGTTNRKTIKIEILVRDAKCTDAGIYICGVKYYKGGLTKEYNGTQNATAEAGTTGPFLSLSPLNSGTSNLANYSSYNLNDQVTLTCRVDGPQNMAIKWRRERRPLIGSGDIYEDYPYASDIKTEPTTQSGTDACVQFQYVSRLNFSVTENDKNRLYMCAVQEANAADGVYVATTAAIVDLIIAKPSPGPNPVSAGGDKDSIGLIVGVVLGCLAVIIIVAIIVGVVCYRRRSKKNNNKDDADRPDGAANEQTYPTVASRTPYDNNYDRGSKISTGRPNRALDTSFDSTNKGPPVYSITNNNDPALQRGNNKKYVNAGFDESNTDYGPRPPPVAPKPQTNVRRYSTDDGTDDYNYYGNEDMGTGV